MAVAYRRGIPLEDMEMYQFHPTGLYKVGILLSEAARGEGAYLLNSEGERFCVRYAPTMEELAPRDMVSRFIYQEIAEGRGIDGKDYVYLSVAHLGKEKIDAKLPDITDFARNYLGVEPYYEPVPIQPTAHYAMGGIPTDIEGRVVMDEKNTVAARPLRGRRGGLRLGAWRQPPGHQLAGGPDRLRAARRQAHRRRSGCQRPSFAPLPEDAEAFATEMVESAARAQDRRARRRRSARRCATR